MRRCITLPAVVSLLTLAAGAAAADPMSRYYARDTQGVFWFMHLSDLHVDSGDNPGATNLETALTKVVDVIHPVYVFVSGDLTDGSVLGVPTTGQVQDEWDKYNEVLSKTSMTPATYFDLPGNHDSYNDQGLTFWCANSVQGKAHGGKLFVEATHTTPLGEYYFVGLNSSGLWGKPLTWGNPEFTNVDDLVAGLQAHPSAQLVFAFAHHHITPHGDTVVGDDAEPINAQEVSQLLTDAGALYFHGHVHQFKQGMEGALVAHQINKIDGDGVVDRSSEQAYADTMFQSNIGVGIVDHNAVIYRGTALADPWPLVAITAPVDQYLSGGGQIAEIQGGVYFKGDFEPYMTTKNPYAYDVCRDAKDNPVRAVVLAAEPVTSVLALIDGSVVASLEPVSEPKGLYAGEMDTTTISTGEHRLMVRAKTASASRDDTIWVNFTKGPCAPLGDAGVDAEAGAGGSAGHAGAAGAAGQAGGGGTAADAGKADACADCNVVPPLTDTGGCSCRAPASPATRVGSAMLLAALLGVLRRRHVARRSNL